MRAIKWKFTTVENNFLISKFSKHERVPAGHALTKNSVPDSETVHRACGHAINQGLFLCMCVKKSQDQVKILGFYRPYCTRPILTPGIRICSQKWCQVKISIDYGYISQVKILYKVKFSKLEICQSDCRFKILAKNCVKKVSFFFQNFD